MVCIAQIVCQFGGGSIGRWVCPNGLGSEPKAKIMATCLNQETLRKYFKGSKPRPLTKKMRVAVQKATSSKSKISSLKLRSSPIVMAERESLLTEVRDNVTTMKASHSSAAGTIALLTSSY